MKNIDIRMLVSEKGLRYKDIADELNISREHLSRLMRNTLTTDNKVRIMRAINTLTEKETAQNKTIMSKREAIEYAKEHFSYDKNSDFCALVRLRHKAVMFPEYGTNGRLRDDCNWAYFDMAGKIGTGMYGDVYYF